MHSFFHQLRLSGYIVVLILVVSGAHAQDPRNPTITSLVNKNWVELKAELQTGNAVYQKIVEPCTGKKQDGKVTVQKLLRDQLDSRVEKSIADIFKQPRLARDYFGDMTQKAVVKYAKTEVRSRETTEQIIILATDLCGSPGGVAPPPTRKNRAPTANAGADDTITLPRNYITLNGTGSDNDNDPLTYKWKKLTKQYNDQIDSPNSRQTRIVNLNAGVHLYRLTVSDNHGASDSDVVSITVNLQSAPPSANAGNDTTITLPSSKVTLNGSGKDPNRSPLTFRWTKFSGKAGDRIVSDTSARTAVEHLQQGVYQYILTVTNKYKLFGRDFVRVTVNPPSQINLPPIAHAGRDTTITLPVNQVTLIGKGDDPDGDELTYQWIKLPDQRTFPAGSRVVTDKLLEGVYTFVLKVTDEHGASGTDAVTITVKPPIPVLIDKKRPVADAGNDQRIQLSEEGVVLTGSGEDSDGKIVSYHWTKLVGPDSFHIVSPANSQTVVNDLTAGTYVFELKVTDNDGLTGTDMVILQLYTPPGGTPWIWISLAVLAAAASGYTIYIIWWRWKVKMIIVYFLNKDEEVLARTLMAGSHETYGYVVGPCSRGKIQDMKKKGLVLRILNPSVLTVNTPGVSRTYKFSFKKGEPRLESETREPLTGKFQNLIAAPTERKGTDLEFPAFYIITLDIPLLRVFKERLQDTGITILQRIPYNSYIILVRDKNQLYILQHGAEFKFIRMIQEYSPEDTGFIVRKDHPAKLKLDLLLHREEDSAVVRDFLGINGIEYFASYRNTIRIRVTPDRNIAYKLASNKFIQAIYEHIPPALHNNIARQLTGIDATTPGETYIDEKGDGEIIAVADTGIDGDHPDLSNRIIGAVSWGRKVKGDTSDPHGHGTHVTGSIVGNGNSSGGEIKGIAPGAKVFFQSLLDENDQLCDLELQLPSLLKQAYEKNARIVNISWGSATESFYTFDSVAMDRFVYENPEMLIVVSAGNEGVGGFGSIGSPATTKNGLTVGASLNKRKDEDPESVAPFSSRGPCKSDRRIKPDIVAPGTNILSTKSSLAPDRNFESFYTNPAYVFMGGTSMATPIVSGAAALVREYYNKTKLYRRPSAALIKATLINGTRRLTAESAMLGSEIIPNNNQGYGMLDLSMTIPNKHHTIKLEFCDSLMDPSLSFYHAGERRMFRLTIKEKNWIRVSLVFIDNPAMGMQSDLDLIVGHEGTIQKWTGNAGINLHDPFLSATEEDFTNNTEIIRIDDAEAGSYIVEVVATNIAPEGNPWFALVVTTGDLSGEFSTETI